MIVQGESGRNCVVACREGRTRDAAFHRVFRRGGHCHRISRLGEHRRVSHQDGRRRRGVDQRRSGRFRIFRFRTRVYWL